MHIVTRLLGRLLALAARFVPGSLVHGTALRGMRWDERRRRRG